MNSVVSKRIIATNANSQGPWRRCWREHCFRRTQRQSSRGTQTKLLHNGTQRLTTPVNKSVYNFSVPRQLCLNQGFKSFKNGMIKSTNFSSSHMKFSRCAAEDKLTQSIIPGCSGCQWNRTLTSHAHSHHIKRTDVKALKKELNAIAKLAGSDGLNTSAILSFIKNLPKGGSRAFGTSSQRGQQSQEDDKDKKPNQNEKVPFNAWMAMMVWIGFIMYIVLRLQAGEDGSVYHFISWNEFLYDMLIKGEVSEIIVRPEAELAFIHLQPGAIIRGRKVDADTFALKVADPYKFEDKVRRIEEEMGIKPGQGISISYSRENSWTGLVFMAIVGLALFLVFRNMFKMQMPDPMDMFASERKAKFVRVDQQSYSKAITFKDVAGLHEAKIEIMEFVDYLKNSQRYKDLGAKIPRGALLLGPPGCGKTLLAKAVASESDVPFLAMAGSDFVEIVGGLGAARVRDLFKEARQKAPCVIYVDEIDAIGRQRGGNAMEGGGGEQEHTLNQLLVEMDGMQTVEGVIMLASTNRADILDKALLRPGRFDRHIMIDLPTLAERRETFTMYLEKLRLAQNVNKYVERLAQLSPGMSGADIANICNEAALHAARDQKKKIDHEDFDYAVERVVAGVAKKSRVLSPQEKKIVAYHEAGHALVGWLLEHTDALLKVSIVPRTSSVLGFAQYMPSDQKLHSKEELFERMCMALGGRVAESLTFNAVTSGAQDDLKKVTSMAYAQIKQLGMNERVGHLSFPQESETGTGTRPYSKQLANIMDQEAQLMVADAYKQTEKLLRDNKEKLRVLAEELLEKESLTYEDLEQLIGPPTYGKKGSTTGWGASAGTSPV